MHYSVAAGRSEIGIRMAIGARAAGVLKLILGEATRVAFMGVAVGLVAIWLTDAIRGMLFNIRATDPVVFTTAAFALLVVAIVASYGPAHRASRIDPMSALRNE